MKASEILAAATDEQKAASRAGKRPFEDPFWTVYNFVCGHIVCPQCGGACPRDFYSCGDPQCCYTHCGNECYWAPNQLSRDESVRPTEEYDFREVAPGEWRPIGTFDYYERGEPVPTTATEQHGQ